MNLERNRGGSGDGEVELGVRENGLWRQNATKEDQCPPRDARVALVFGPFPAMAGNGHVMLAVLALHEAAPSLAIARIGLQA